MTRAAPRHGLARHRHLRGPAWRPASSSTSSRRGRATRSAASRRSPGATAGSTTTSSPALADELVKSGYGDYLHTAARRGRRTTLMEIRPLSIDGRLRGHPAPVPRRPRRVPRVLPRRPPRRARRAPAATSCRPTSRSPSRGTVRGIHFADVPPGQAKYVTAIAGSLVDFVVDIRVGSPTFGQWDAVAARHRRPPRGLPLRGAGPRLLRPRGRHDGHYLCSERLQPRPASTASTRSTPSSASACPTASSRCSRRRTPRRPPCRRHGEQGLLPRTTTASP